MKLAFILAALLLGAPSLVNAQTKKTRSAPVKMTMDPKFTASDNAAWKGKSMTATVSLLVSEDGHVIQATVVKAKPRNQLGPFFRRFNRRNFSPDQAAESGG